jgi:hypothetical protein
MQRNRSAKILVATLFVTVVLNVPSGAADMLDCQIEKARSEKQIDRRLHALASVGNELTLAEIPNALKAADNLKSFREQLALRDSTLKRWGELAPAAAFAHVSQMAEGVPKVELGRSIAVAYARTNGPAAAAAALNVAPGRARTEAVSLISETWARNNAREALTWAKELPESALKQIALRSIYFVWVHSDPVAASETVQNLPSDDTKNALLMNVAQNWAVTDAPAAIKWARSLPIEAERDLAVVIATESWADSDPSTAIEFAASLKSSELRQRAFLVALERWATQNPQQAFDKAAGLGDSALQEQGIARVLGFWAPLCPDAARRAVEQLPVGRVRDSAIGAYVEAASAWQFEAATRLAAKVSDLAARQQRIEQPFRLWLASDPQSAKRWLKNAELKDEFKVTLLSSEF